MSRAAMHKTTLPLRAAAFAAVILLAGCKPATTVVEPPDDMKNALAEAKPVTLPPAIKSSKTYRCKDNSIIYVSFMTDDVTAAIRAKEQDPPIATLKADAVGQPFVGTGYTLSGSGADVTYTSPDGGAQACHA